LLRDDLRDTALAASLLSLVGRGCHRLSEIAARLEKPATSLSRPLQRLVDLELIRRDLPFGASTRDSKRTLYRIADPFLRFWFRFVEPNRSRLEAHQVDAVARQVSRELPLHASSVWEDLARESVSALRCFGKSWKPARRWWGPGLDRKPLEIDLVAESADGRALLLGEARWSGSREAARLLSQLERKAANFPAATGRNVRLALWLGDSDTYKPSPDVFGPEAVLRALR
jgi:AAA+ ATPase superfamily predicted ATPase